MKNSPVDNSIPDPSYPCRNEYCAQETSYPVDMLAMHPEGGVICGDCWEEEATEDSPRFWELPPFRPVKPGDDLGNGLVAVPVEELRDLLKWTDEVGADPVVTPGLSAMIQAAGETQ